MARENDPRFGPMGAVGMSRRTALAGLAASGVVASAGAASAKTRGEIDAGVRDALYDLFRYRPAFRSLYQRSEGVLVIPDIIKAGFIIGAAYGEGALLRGDATDSYWTYTSASLGFQAGAQRMRLALFLLAPQELDRFMRGDVAEIGAEAELTVFDSGLEFGVDTTETMKPVVAVVFGREGLLGGASFQTAEFSRMSI